MEKGVSPSVAVAGVAVVMLIDRQGLISFGALDALIEAGATFTLRVAQEVLAILGRGWDVFVSLLRGE